MQVFNLEGGRKFEEICKFSFRLANKLKSYIGRKFEEISSTHQSTVVARRKKSPREMVLTWTNIDVSR